MVLKNNAGHITQQIEYRYDAFDDMIGRNADVTANDSDAFELDEAGVERYVGDRDQIVIAQHSTCDSGVDALELPWGVEVDQILAQDNFDSGTNAFAATSSVAAPGFL